MKFAVRVDAGPTVGDAGDSAYQFIRAAIRSGHEIVRIFFYHDGAYQGLDPGEQPGDELDGYRRWIALAQEFGTELVICISAAQRRGVGDCTIASDSLALAGSTAGFRLGGLGLWVDACTKADRIIQFRS